MPIFKMIFDWKKVLIVLGLFSFLILSRFGFLNWGAPWYFHPDERNVASAVTTIYDQIQNGDPDALNPHFFAYGGLPIYIILVITSIVKQFTNQRDTFELAILVSRSLSALWMTVVPLITWKIAKQWGKEVARIGLLLSICCVGYIQFARFGTFESWLTINYLFLLWILINLSKKWSTMLWIGATFVTGIALGIKIPSLYLIPLLGLVWLWESIRLIKRSHTIPVKILMLINMTINACLGFLVLGLVFVISNPYAFKNDIAKLYNDNPSYFAIRAIGESVNLGLNPNLWNRNGLANVFGNEFLHSINVEGDIAKGNIKVFYTRHFWGTTGGIYQLLMILPWLVSIPIIALSLLGFGILFWMAIKKHRPSILLLIWVILQLSFIFPLYVKWTRYMVPILPSFIIAASLAGSRINKLIAILWHDEKTKNIKNLLKIGVAFGLIWHLTYTLMFFVMITQPDTRIEAANWMDKMMKKDIRVLSEVYDLGILPFNNVISPARITLFNFYDLDDNQVPEIDIERAIENNDVVVILSRRIWKHTTDYPEKYPRAAKFYNSLLNGDAGFIKIQEFSNYPRFGPWIVNDEVKAEETFGVFDHPRVQIWIKQSRYSNIML